MADWWDSFPGAGPLLGGSFQDPYGGATSPSYDIGGLGSQWLDQILGNGSGGLPTFQGFGTNPGLGGMYAGAAPPTAAPYSGYASPLQGLYQPYNPPNMSSYPPLQAFMAPPTLMPQPQGVGGYGSALAQTYPGLQFGQFGAQQYTPSSSGGQGFGGAQAYGGQQYGGQQGQSYGGQPYGGAQAARGRTGTAPAAASSYGGQAAGQQAYGQPYQAGQTGQQYGYSGGTSSPTAAGGYSQDRMPFSIPSGGVYGQSKWLPGSTGADIFLPRNTPITAKTGGKILYATGGSALSGGSDTIAQFDDGTVARFRHVQPNLQAGQSFRPGQVLAVVNDSSMDMLSRQVAAQIGAPDGFQHLDLSINPPGQTQFSPQGGGGGALSAPQWLQQMGYQGRVVGRTPGPQEGMSGGGGGQMGFGGMPGGGGSPFGGGGQMGFGGMPQMGMGMNMGMGQQGNPFAAMLGQGFGQQFGQGLGGYGGLGQGFGMGF